MHSVRFFSMSAYDKDLWKYRSLHFVLRIKIYRYRRLSLLYFLNQNDTRFISERRSRDWPNFWLIKTVCEQMLTPLCFLFVFAQNRIALQRNFLECIISPTAMIYSVQCSLYAFFTHQREETDVHVKRVRKLKFLKKMNQEICALKSERWKQELRKTFSKWFFRQ